MALDAIEPRQREVCGFLFAVEGNTSHYSLVINTEEKNSHLAAFNLFLE